MERRFTPLVLIAIAITVVAWASAFVVIRGVQSDISGGALALGRLVVGTALLTIPLVLSRKWVKPTGREWLLLIGFGVLWFGVYNIALNLAEATVDAGTTSMIVNIGPILIALGGGIILKEGISRWLIVGAVLAFVGVVLIAVGSGAVELANPGVLLCLVAALTYAAGVLFQKVVLRRLPSVQVTWIGAAIGLVCCLPFTGQLVAEASTAPLPSILGMVYLGAVPTALAFTTWGYALTRVPASQLGISTYLVPPLVILMALAFFGEIPSWLAIVGGAVCLIGVAVSRYRPRVVEPAPTLAE